MLHQGLLDQWNIPKMQQEIFLLFDVANIVEWSLASKKIFFVKSIYMLLEIDIARYNNNWIQKSKFPLKILYMIGYGNMLS
jgi:hypothetical protein